MIEKHLATSEAQPRSVQPRGHSSGINQAPLRRVMERVNDLYDDMKVWERYETCGHWFPARRPPFGVIRPKRRCWPCQERAKVEEAKR